MTIEEVVARLDGVTRHSDIQYSARCPAHDDRTASLSVGLNEKGDIVLNCHAGCEKINLAMAMSNLGVKMSDLFPGSDAAKAASRGKRGDDRGKLVCTYLYRDLHGTVVHAKDRYDPKRFAQKRPGTDGKWIYDLKGVRQLLYHVPEIAAENKDKWVLVVEGERDADNAAKLGFVATTNAGGAGKWHQVDDSILHGRKVCVIPDRDEPGRKHANDIVRSLAGKAAELRVLRLIGPTDGPKKVKDLSDWIVFNGEDSTPGDLAADLLEDIENAQIVTEPPPPEPDEPKGERKAAGKQEAATDESEGGPVLQNYLTVETKRESLDKALPPQEITAALGNLTDGWPRRCTNMLFVPQQKRILPLADEVDLFSWIKSFASVQWKRGSDDCGTEYVKHKELFRHLATHAFEYSAVSPFPFEPPRDDVFCTWEEPTYVAVGDWLNTFLDRFCPSTESDRSLIRALLLTMLWGGGAGQRPLVIVTGDGSAGQECGKSRLVRLLADVVGGTFEPHLTGPRRLGDDLTKQLTSDQALAHRVVLFDNSTGVLRDDLLTDLITAPVIHGRPVWGRQTSRVNLLTYAVTTNDLSLSTDLSSRAVVIRLRMPDRDANPAWESKTRQMIADHRDQIIADALVALRGPRYRITARCSRFSEWCHAVLALDPAVNAILPELVAGARTADADADDISYLLNELLRRWRAGELNPWWHDGRYRLSPKQLADSWFAATGERLTTAWTVRRLTAAQKRGRLHALWPVGTKHGSDWIFDPQVAEDSVEGEVDIPSDLTDAGINETLDEALGGAES